MTTSTRLRGGLSRQTWSARRIVTKTQTHALNILMLIGLMCAMAPSATAQASNDSLQRAIDRAHRFLSTNRRAEATLNFVHFGTDFKGQEYRKTLNDSDRTPGGFALVYRLFWNNDGVTDIAYHCYSNGNVYAVQIMYSNAEGNVPFLWANVSIQILGNLLIETYKDKLSQDDRRLLQKLIDKADAKPLLEWSLRLDQLASGD